MDGLEVTVTTVLAAVFAALFGALTHDLISPSPVLVAFGALLGAGWVVVCAHAFTNDSAMTAVGVTLAAVFAGLFGSLTHDLINASAPLVAIGSLVGAGWIGFCFWLPSR